MSHEHPRRSSVVPFATAEAIPSAPPLPAPRPLQRARDAATRFFGYSSRPVSPQEDERLVRGGGRARFASLSASQNATASHKTGLEINTIAINEKGTHALLGGKEIFKTIRVEDGSCAEELNLRSAIRSNPTQASGRARQIYSIDIADVAWAKGDCGDYVAAATSSGKVILYDLGHAGVPAAQLHEHFRHVHKVTFNPHRGSLLLSGSQDGTVRLWDVRDVKTASTLQSKRKYSGQSDGVRDVKWSPTEGVDFAFGTDSGWIQRWDMRNLKTAKVKIPAHSETCNTIDWHPGGKYIVSASSDKTVRVWDFSVSKRQKASWEIKTPYPVLNARWRPSCESSMPKDNGARQCTQLVTSYDESHPVLHIWDFRRPALPFREMAPYSSSPTDLLWHSQDLLWTVGREGVFLQADIQHAPKIIEKRNLQACALSPLDDVNFVTQKRRSPQKIRSLPQKQVGNVKSTSSSLSQSPEHTSLGYLSRSWADDGLDHSFLSWKSPPKSKQQHHPQTSGRSTPKTRTQSVSMASSNDQSHTTTTMTMLDLDDMLNHRLSFKPPQAAVRGKLPFMFKDAETFAFMAKQYKIDPTTIPNASNFANAIKEFEEVMEHNARVAEHAEMYKTGTTWRMLAFWFTEFLKAVNKNPTTDDVEEENPFRAAEMLQQAMDYYVSKGDAQTAAHMFFLLRRQLPRASPLPEQETSACIEVFVEHYTSLGFESEQIDHMIDKDILALLQAGIQPLKVSAILTTYHESLVKMRLDNQAAVLRELAYPAFPSVYEDYLSNNQVKLDGKRQSECPFCREKGSNLWTACLLCGHGGHLECLNVWFGEEGESGCLTEGCLCNCVVGKEA